MIKKFYVPMSERGLLDASIQELKEEFLGIPHETTLSLMDKATGVVELDGLMSQIFGGPDGQ